MIGDAFVHVETRRPAESGGEIDTFLPVGAGAPIRLAVAMQCLHFGTHSSLPGAKVHACEFNLS
jgi:hypothetical protein